MWCTGILVPMARARTPEGKRVVIPVRVSEPLAAGLDKARGELTRSAWVRGVLAAYLASDGGQASTVHEPAHSPRPVYVHAEPAPMEVYAYTATPEPELTPEPARKRMPAARSCTHKRVTSSKGGKCHDCSTWVPASS